MIQLMLHYSNSPLKSHSPQAQSIVFYITEALKYSISIKSLFNLIHHYYMHH